LPEKHVVLVFVDGLGLGPADSPANPLAHPDLHLLSNFLPPGWTPPLAGGRPPRLPAVERAGVLPHPGGVVATDASLGLPGLPQSATGQTTILTGVNAGEAVGRHLYGFPNRTLRTIIAGSSVLRLVGDAGGRASFANAYRPRFFELGDAIWQRPLSATTWACRAGGLPFMTIQDLEEGRAIYQDITHETLREHGIPVPLREPEPAGEILAEVSRDFDFTLFEFFQTDRAGHAQDRDWATRELLKLERFLGAALDAMDLGQTTLIITSDHGNIEDLGVKTHTLNPVPTIVLGRASKEALAKLDRLENVTPIILDLLGLSDA
jgi:hypothetical protein